METRAEKLCPCLIGFDNIVYPKETLNKARLTALHAICVQIFRHIAQKSLAIRQYACGISRQSAEESDNAPYAQALYGVALEKLLCRFFRCGSFFLSVCEKNS